MTETSILPGAVPEQAAPEGAGVPPPPEFDDEPTGGDRRRLIIVGAVVGVVVVVVAAYFLLRGGSSSDDNLGAVPRGTPPAAQQTQPSGNGHGGGVKAGKAGQAAGATLPKKSHTRLARDPFKPLITPPQVGTGTNPVATTNVAPPADSGTQGTSFPSQSGTTTTTSTGTGGATTNPPGVPQWIELVGTTGTKSATFDVGYAHHKVYRFAVVAPSPTSQRGTVFDGVFSLLGIQGKQVTLQVGDATPFDLSRGVAHSV